MSNFFIHTAKRGSTCRYQNGAQLLELCVEADMFPCMFLRRLLEQVPWTCNKNVRQTNIATFATATMAVLPLHLCFLDCCTTARLLCALAMPGLMSLSPTPFLGAIFSTFTTSPMY